MARWPFGRRRAESPVAAADPAMPAGAGASALGEWTDGPAPSGERSIDPVDTAGAGAADAAGAAGVVDAAGPAAAGAGRMRRRAAWLRLPPLDTASSASGPATMDLSDSIGVVDIGDPGDRSGAFPALPAAPIGLVGGLVRPVPLTEIDPDPVELPVGPSHDSRPVRPLPVRSAPDAAPESLTSASDRYVAPPRVPDVPWRPEAWLHEAAIEKDRRMAIAAAESGLLPPPSVPTPVPTFVPPVPPSVLPPVPEPAPLAVEFPATLPEPSPAPRPARAGQRASLAESRRRGLTLRSTAPAPADAASMDPSAGSTVSMDHLPDESEAVAREVAAREAADRLAAEREAAEREAAEREAADRLDAEREVADRLAAEQRAADLLAAEQQAAADLMAAERRAVEQLAADRDAAALLAAEQQVADMFAEQVAAAEQLAAEFVAAEQWAAEQAADRDAAAILAAQQQVADVAAAEQLAAEQRAAEQLAAEQQAEQQVVEQLAAEQQVAEQRVTGQQVAEWEAVERQAAEFVAGQRTAEREAGDRPAADHAAAGRTAAEGLAAERLVAEQRAADQDAMAARFAAERAEADLPAARWSTAEGVAETDRLAAETPAAGRVADVAAADRATERRGEDVAAGQSTADGGPAGVGPDGFPTETSQGRLRPLPGPDGATADGPMSVTARNLGWTPDAADLVHPAQPAASRMDPAAGSTASMDHLPNAAESVPPANSTADVEARAGARPDLGSAVPPVDPASAASGAGLASLSSLADLASVLSQVGGTSGLPGADRAAASSPGGSASGTPDADPASPGADPTSASWRADPTVASPTGGPAAASPPGGPASASAGANSAAASPGGPTAVAPHPDSAAASSTDGSAVVSPGADPAAALPHIDPTTGLADGSPAEHRTSRPGAVRPRPVLHHPGTGETTGVAPVRPVAGEYLPNPLVHGRSGRGRRADEPGSEPEVDSPPGQPDFPGGDGAGRPPSELAGTDGPKPGGTASSTDGFRSTSKLTVLDQQEMDELRSALDELGIGRSVLDQPPGSAPGLTWTGRSVDARPDAGRPHVGDPYGHPEAGGSAPNHPGQPGHPGQPPQRTYGPPTTGGPSIGGAAGPSTHGRPTGHAENPSGQDTTTWPQLTHRSTPRPTDDGRPYVTEVPVIPSDPATTPSAVVTSGHPDPGDGGQRRSGWRRFLPFLRSMRDDVPPADSGFVLVEPADLVHRRPAGPDQPEVIDASATVGRPVTDPPPHDPGSAPERRVQLAAVSLPAVPLPTIGPEPGTGPVALIPLGRAAVALRPSPRPVPIAVAPAVEVGVPASVAGRVGRIHAIDVSDVTVRRGPAVSARARQLGARGFTEDGVVHVPDEVGPLDSGPGGALLAHELTHVVQQRRYGSALPTPDSDHGRQLEAEAQAVEQFYDSVESSPDQEVADVGRVVDSWSFDGSAPGGIQLAEDPFAGGTAVLDETDDFDAWLDAQPSGWGQMELIGLDATDATTTNTTDATAINATATDTTAINVTDATGDTIDATPGGALRDGGNTGPAGWPASTMTWNPDNGFVPLAPAMGEPGSTVQSLAGASWGFADPAWSDVISANDPIDWADTYDEDDPDLTVPAAMLRQLLTRFAEDPPRRWYDLDDRGAFEELTEEIGDDPPRRWLDLDSSEDLDELANRLYDRLLDRLRFDVLVQRERSGTLMDFG